MDNNDFLKFLTQVLKNADMVMDKGSSFYIWIAFSSIKEILFALSATNLTLKQELIWVKNNFVLGRQDYQWRHEECLYGWKEGAPHYFIDVRSFDTVADNELSELTREEAIKLVKELSSLTTAIYEDKPLTSDLHPTMKPVTLFKKLIRNSSQEGDIVLDLFGGSGTTLIAAEEMGRICHIMELDEHYAETIIARWEKRTGQKAVRILE